MYSNSTGTDKEGTGGAITLSAGGSIDTQDIYSNSNASSGIGGAITLNADGGKINTQALYSNSPSGTEGTGGEIALSATDTINLTSINSSGGMGSGNITINSSNAPFVFHSGAISSDTFGSGKAGNIQISATSISLANGAQLSASTHRTGAGGDITLVASDTVELSGETTTSPESLFPLQFFVSEDFGNAIGLPPGTYLGGYIPNGTTDKPPERTVFPSGVFSQATINSTGSAGNLKIETRKLIINNGAAIATTTFGKNSNAGDISIKANDSIKIDSGSILSGVAPNAIGNSGKVELNTSNLELTNSGIVQTQTLGEGVAGNIVVNADTVSISNKGSALRSASGGTNELLPGTSSSSKIGRGGNISVTANNLLQVTDGAVLDATTVTNSTGGDITVSANTLSVDKGGQILTSTSGTGDAGNITVNAAQIQLSDLESGLLAQTTSAGKAGNLIIQPRGDAQSLKVFFQKGAQISVSTSSSGKGGTLSITAPESITLTGDGSIISAKTTGAGNGGDLTLRTGELVAQDGAQVTVNSTNNSTNSGQAGNLTVDANFISLDNHAQINADTQGGGGNIILNSPLLFLRHGSSITTNASGDNITGGDITIDAKNGFIIAVPNENSDIRADSANSRGGNVTINNAAGIYGIQSRKEPSPQSDITAKGATPDLSGRLQINRSDVDPAKGLVSLTTDVVDVARLVDENICTRTAKSSFTYSGSGGLPPSPNNTLNSDAVWEDWRLTAVSKGKEGERDRGNSESPLGIREQGGENNSSRPTQIVEAQGWIINKNGEVIFTAYPSTATPHKVGSSSLGCQPPIAN